MICATASKPWHLFGVPSMHGLLLSGFLAVAAVGTENQPPAEPIWLKDYAAAKAKALRENKPIFAVFR